MPVADVVLGALWAWYAYDDANTARLAKKYKPLALPEKPKYKSTDVSIIIPTIDTPETFTDCLRLWLANHPREIIIVTIERDLKRVHDLVKPVIAEGDDRITLMTADHANKRQQLVAGMKEAKGRILALVDDDAFWSTVEVLPHLLAGFEDPGVGGCVGKQSLFNSIANRVLTQPYSAHIPRDRRDPAVITPWEVASLRSLDNQNNVQAVRFAADGGCFCLVGRTLLMRTEIAQDPEFLHAITHEYWRGKLLNTGDDVFVTRWLQAYGWDVSIQNAPEAEITTHVMRDSDLLRQMVRWQRNATQSQLCMVFEKPGFFKLYQKHPYMARKLIERLLRPIIAWTHIFAFVQGLRNNSWVAYFVALWYIWGWAKSYSAFDRRFPWVRSQLWAAFLLDNAHPILDVYSWLTLSTEAWGTRNEDA
ncbi:N-acetylglucosaminyltransferase [Colletotrichum chlorophyti]|uniref:N-acetylglucosaminyltransferase n=1 Tax=Colletotrichum chlorophyti TaxID=708187 RepID=A0A1Q8RHC1_9PEZI|nr:N-acetylglucosaminyltransferase [Colletotrichum chlorophyti]